MKKEKIKRKIFGVLILTTVISIFLFFIYAGYYAEHQAHLESRKHMTAKHKHIKCQPDSTFQYSEEYPFKMHTTIYGQPAISFGMPGIVFDIATGAPVLGY